MTRVGNYLFNIQNPEGTVKAVAESAMREVVGRSNIQPILTGARTTNEQGVQELMQKTLDSYGAGILVQQVQMQKVRSAGASDRRVPRRAGGARRSTSDCRTKRRPTPTASFPTRAGRAAQNPAGRRRLQGAGGRRGQGPERAGS